MLDQFSDAILAVDEQRDLLSEMADELDATPPASNHVATAANYLDAALTKLYEARKAFQKSQKISAQTVDTKTI